MSELEYPQDLRYTAEHEWVRSGDDGTVRIGITSFAQDSLGDVVYVSLPTVGDTVAAGDACGEVESTKSVSDLYAPLAGEVTAVNERPGRHPRAGQHRPLRRGLDVRAAPVRRRRGRAPCSTRRHTRPSSADPRGRAFAQLRCGRHRRPLGFVLC